MNELKDAIIEDGKVDAAEVAQLKEVMLADGVIDRAEADVLFEINDACSGNDNDPAWETFFVESIASHVLEDEETPGVIDATEGDWLADHIEGDGSIDEVEQSLITYLSENSTAIESTRFTALVDMVNNHNASTDTETETTSETADTTEA